MKTFAIHDGPRLDQLLALREAELCFQVGAGAGPHEVAGFAKPQSTDVGEAEAEADRTRKAFMALAVEHAAQELEQVLAARSRIQDHCYGRCLACGSAIALERLLAQPACRWCLACQSAYDVRHPPPLRH